MKKILSIFLLFFVSNQSLNSMMDEDGEYFPVSSGVTRKIEEETLIKDIIELKLQKALLLEEIENLKKALLEYKREKRALVAIRNIRQHQQEDEAATLLAKMIMGLHMAEKREEKN